jgi:hypothetical protein
MSSERDCVDRLVNVSADRTLSLQETVAVGLLVARKWDRASSEIRGDAPSTAGAAVRYDNFTSAEVHGFRSAASRMLAE